MGAGIAGSQHTEENPEGDTVEGRADQVVVAQNEQAVDAHIHQEDGVSISGGQAGHLVFTGEQLEIRLGVAAQQQRQHHTGSEEDAAEFKEAYADLGAALTSTYMETEEFEAKTERFESIVNKVTNGAEKDDDEGETNAFLSFFAKIFKFLSDMFLRFFGGKGFSDILK